MNMNTNMNTHWDQDAEEEMIGHWYGSNGPYGDSPSPSLASSDTSLSWAYQAALRPITVHHGRAPSPQGVASISVMPSFVWAARYSDPQYPYYYNAWGRAHFYPVHSSTDPSMGGFVPQVHHMQMHSPPPPPPYVYHHHQLVQEQESFGGPSTSMYAEDFLHTNPHYHPAQEQVFCDDSSSAGDLHQPSPGVDSPLHEYSCKSPRGKELFVYHLPSDMNNDELRNLFSQYGVVTRASVARHKTGVSRLFAFVKFKLQIGADEALLHLNDYRVRVSIK
jgi:hypothetical protein